MAVCGAHRASFSFNLSLIFTRPFPFAVFT